MASGVKKLSITAEGIRKSTQISMILIAFLPWTMIAVLREIRPGLMIAYAIKNPAAFDGIILLAAYPADQVPDSLSVCSIYGDRDTKLDAKAYASHKANFPADTEEVVIEGANHAQFGDYGDQKGDSEATISPAEQQAQTAEIILAFINGEQ